MSPDRHPHSNIPSIDIAAAFSTPPPKLDFVFDGLLAGSVGGIVAPGGAGKSFLALCLASYVASGYDPTGGALPQIGGTGRVVYLPAEDPAIVLQHRLHHLGAHLPPHARDAVAENLDIRPLVGFAPDLCCDQRLDWIVRAAEGARLTIIDTLRRYHSKDENNNGDMALVLSRLEQIVRRTGTTILFLHHTSKQGMQSGDQSASRGASSITDNCRWQGALRTMTEEEAEKRGVDDDCRRDFVQFATSKSNYGRVEGEIWLRRVEGGMLRAASVPVVPGYKLPKVKEKKQEKEKVSQTNDRVEVDYETDF